MNFSATLEELKLIGQGDHMVLLYDNNEYNAEMSAAYISSRITRNEKCFYVAGDDEYDLLMEKLEGLIDVDKVIKTGQLNILSKNDAYSKDGCFNPSSMIQLLKKLSLEAIDEGYEAFAVTGEISWVLEYESGFKKIMEYEYMLNHEIFGQYPVSAICRYSLNKFSSEMIKHIIEVHTIIIWEGQIHDNPFYMDVIDTSDINIDEFQVNSMLQTITSFTNTKSRFYQELKEKEHQNEVLQLNLMKSIIMTLTSLLEIHDEYTKNHSEHVALVAKKIATELGLSQVEVNEIFFAGLVHDIGKTVIPHEIINKKARLTEAEFELIKKHSYYGYESLTKIDVLKSISELVLYHHERFDGKGYPAQIAGEAIPLGARILCVADAYDAMVNDRPYHQAMQKGEAIEELQRCSGTQFDQRIVDVFIESIKTK